MVKKRKCPIKALLLDQSFSAGVGNWIADEILFQARIHPEQVANTLNDAQIALMHEKMVSICQTAVDAHADSSKFPDDWLFRHRWGKGKKEKSTPLLLPDGQAAKIKWLTVGGRTSAFVEQVQKLSKVAGSSATKQPRKRSRKALQEKHEDDSSDLTDLSDAPGLVEHAEAAKSTMKRGKRKTAEQAEDEDDYDGDLEERKASSSSQPAKRPRKLAEATEGVVVGNNLDGPVATGTRRSSRKVRR